MTHTRPISRPLPVKAFYYNISLTQKISELATIASLLDTVIGTVKTLVSADA
ncbi:MAG: hypothetical protein QG656_1350 [Candidatus Hydrogenedentes bacterium]|nr:hypothetical protein [Candidatus Hydrogenedentota bacterium]